MWITGGSLARDIKYVPIVHSGCDVLNYKFSINTSIFLRYTSLLQVIQITFVISFCLHARFDVRLTWHLCFFQIFHRTRARFASLFTNKPDKRKTSQRLICSFPARLIERCNLSLSRAEKNKKSGINRIRWIGVANPVGITKFLKRITKFLIFAKRTDGCPIPRLSQFIFIVCIVRCELDSPPPRTDHSHMRVS